jgi:hypothetical protein
MKFQGGHTIEDVLNTILFNSIASTIPKWQMFELLRWNSWPHCLTTVTMVRTYPWKPRYIVYHSETDAVLC